MERTKMRKIQRSTQSSSEHIPTDLILEILSRLPPKSILRCRCVSKLWSSITTTPYFINSFFTSRPNCLLLIFKKQDKLFVFSSPVHRNNTNPQVEYYQLTIPSVGNYLRRYESVHGLVYLETTTHLMIWNPTLKSFLTLPNPKEGKFNNGFLGYDPIEGKHKALCILEGGNEIGIITLGAQESWRILSKELPKHLYTTGFAQCINGVIYYEGFFSGLTRVHGIMCFDLRSEKFSLIQYPTKTPHGLRLVSYEGRLALVSSIVSGGVELWILEDVENHQWIYKHFHSPLAHTRRWKLQGVTNDGKFIYTTSFTYRYDLGLVTNQNSMYKSLRVMYFNPKKTKFMKEVPFGGIAVDDVRRLDQVGFDLTTDFYVIPNHTECLMSL